VRKGKSDGWRQGTLRAPVSDVRGVAQKESGADGGVAVGEVLAVREDVEGQCEVRSSGEGRLRNGEEEEAEDAACEEGAEKGE